MKNITIDFHTLKGDWEDDLHFHGGNEEWTEAEVKELKVTTLPPSGGFKRREYDT
jgi:hypothetical protein